MFKNHHPITLSQAERFQLPEASGVRFLAVLGLLLLLFMFLQLNACAPLDPGVGDFLHPTELTDQHQETKISLEQTRKLLRQGKLKEANQILSSLHNVDMNISEKNEYHFLSGLIFALNDYEYQSYQRALRHLKQVKDVPDDQSLYPTYSSLLSYLLHDVIKQYYQIKELEKTVDQQEQEIMNNQDVCSKLQTSADSLEEHYQELQKKNQQLREKLKAIMKIDTE
ncbi:MAG: hypothetical protein GWP07_04055 [Xanthomonadaceae bacterium]|nr:hypothetical protein [Xanthomonadaceae bacterium]